MRSEVRVEGGRLHILFLFEEFRNGLIWFYACSYGVLGVVN